MPEFDFSGAYLNVDGITDNDLCEINAIPTAEQKESGQQKEIVNGVLVPKKYMVLNIPVNINGSKKIFTPDKNSGLRFQKAWGKDYSKWVNKKFQVKKETYKAFGTDKLRVAGFPIDK